MPKHKDDARKVLPKKDATESKAPQESLQEQYHVFVSERMAETKGWRNEMNELGQGSLTDHVASVFRSSGVPDPMQRMSEVEQAVRRQQDIQAKKRERKRDRMREAIRGANKQMGEGGHQHSQNDGALEESSKGQDKLFRAVTNVVHEHLWTEVNRFHTKEEAIGFVMECQPFSFAPVIENGDAWPQFATSHEAFEYVLKMAPVPMNYSSTVNGFKRRLRIRLMDNEQEHETVRKQVPTHSKRRTSALRQGTGPVATQPRKPWTVEATGTFFENPTTRQELVEKRASMRAEGAVKYFLAVAQDLVQMVLQEGYKVQSRCSIPLSASPQEALSAWKSKGKDVKATVLTVTIPPEIDVVPNRKQGFLVRVKELPPSCFRTKKADTAAPQ